MEIKEFEVIHIIDFGKKFASRNNFVSEVEQMLVDFYHVIVQYLTKWEKAAPKIKGDGIVKNEAVSVSKEAQKVVAKG